MICKKCNIESECEVHEEFYYCDMCEEVSDTLQSCPNGHGDMKLQERLVFDVCPQCGDTV